MSSRIASLGLAVMVGLAFSGGAIACKKVLKRSADPCDLVTDAEMEHATGAKVAAHKGTRDACDWTFDSDKVLSVHVAILSPLAAKIIPQLGKPEPIAGLGEHAEYSGGFAPQMRVTKGGRVLHVMMVEAAPKVTIQEGKTTTVEKKKLPGGGEETLSTTEETIDFPEMRASLIEIAKAAVPRM